MRFIITFAMLLTITACYAHHPHHGGGTNIRVDGVGEVEIHDGHQSPAAKCPPGHAKKHWC